MRTKYDQAHPVLVRLVAAIILGGKDLPYRIERGPDKTIASSK